MDLLRKMRARVLTNAMLTLVIGILFLAFPLKISSFAVIFVGVIILGYGISHLVRYIYEYRNNIGTKGTLIWGIFVCLIGLFFITNVSGLLKFTTRVVSLILFICGVNSTEHALQLKRQNIAGSIFNLSLSIIVTVLGGILFLFPLHGVAWTLRLIGILLILNGLIEVFTLIRMGKIKEEFYETKRTFRGDYDKDIIDVEAREKE